VAQRNLAHDGQAQAAAVYLRAQGPVKGPENRFTLSRRNAGAGVLNLQ
jgi:hypothetical protein